MGEEKDEKKKLPVTLTRSPSGKNASFKTIIILLMVKGADDRYHYLHITNPDRLKEICYTAKRQVEEMLESGMENNHVCKPYHYGRLRVCN